MKIENPLNLTSGELAVFHKYFIIPKNRTVSTKYTRIPKKFLPFLGSLEKKSLIILIKNELSNEYYTVNEKSEYFIFYLLNHFPGEDMDSVQKLQKTIESALSEKPLPTFLVQNY